MAKLWFLASFLTTWAVVVNCGNHHNAPSQSPALALALAPAPARTTDCSVIIYEMSDCISFLSQDSNVTKPDPSCCSGFKSVLDMDAECICEAIKSSAQMGIELNITKAMTLPSACGMSGPPLSNCGISTAPGAAPANPPKSSPGTAPSPKSPKPAVPVPPTAETPAPAAPTGTGGGTVDQVPAPSPTESGAYSISTSFCVLISMVVASFSYISA